jgi:tetratricopeptide (TPR) repeat protein
LARYCAAEAAMAATELEGPAQVEWLNRVRHDLENYRAAMSWLIGRGRADEASGIAWGLKYFWMIRGHAAEGTQWYEHILGAASLSAAGESRALVGAAGMWFAQGTFARARTALDRALALTRGAGDVEIAAQAEYTSAHVERASGNLTAAREGFSGSLERFQELNLRAGMGKALVGLATVAFEAGDFDEAERLAAESASVLSDSGPWFLCFGLWIRALLAVRRNSADEAIGLVRESLVHIRALHDTFAFVYTVIPLAAAAVLKDDHAWAARILGVRDAVAERTAATIIDGSFHDLRGQTERDVRARLGTSRWNKAYAAGRVRSLDSIVKDIDQVLAVT